MKLFIKNMVCNHCKTVVRTELEKIGVQPKMVDFCEAEIDKKLTTDQWNKLNVSLKNAGLELIGDKEVIICEKIRKIIIDMIRYSAELPKHKLSDYLSEKLHINYTYLSSVFSRIQGATLEKFVIEQKIAYAKELLICNELNFSEIADKLHYSSLAHLSKQFKTVTGLTLSEFRTLKQNMIPVPEKLTAK